ncbi:hypothetical protein BX616_008130, partial [Lobosporangium transversale]
MTSSKRKSIVDTAELSKRARLWFTEGLDGISSYLGLKPLESLVIEQQRKKHDWVGAYPGSATKERYVRGVLLKEGQDQHFPAHRRPSPSSLSPNDGSKKPAEPTAAAMDNSEENKPYQLEPYTKLPTFTAPDFRERPSLFSSSLLSSTPSTYGLQIQSADESNSSLASGSPSSSSVSSVTGSSRFSNLPHHNRFEQNSLLRARPRIYASKAQRTTSLLQSKYNKDESVARQRLFERHNLIHSRSGQ